MLQQQQIAATVTHNNHGQNYYKTTNGVSSSNQQQQQRHPQPIMSNGYTYNNNKTKLPVSDNNRKNNTNLNNSNGFESNNSSTVRSGNKMSQMRTSTPPGSFVAHSMQPTQQHVSPPSQIANHHVVVSTTQAHSTNVAAANTNTSQPVPAQPPPPPAPHQPHQPQHLPPPSQYFILPMPIATAQHPHMHSSQGGPVPAAFHHQPHHNHHLVHPTHPHQHPSNGK